MGQLLHRWFGPKTFERGGSLYEKLGVRRFNRFLPFGYYTNLLVRALLYPGFRIVSDRKSAKVWVLFTVVAEAFHTLAFAVFLAIMASDILGGEYAKAALNVLLNLMVNVYPAMAQRYNRIRLLRAFRLDLRDAGHWQI